MEGQARVGDGANNLPLINTKNIKSRGDMSNIPERHFN